jgi:hypothetical protein
MCRGFLGSSCTKIQNQVNLMDLKKRDLTSWSLSVTTNISCVIRLLTRFIDDGESRNLKRNVMLNLRCLSFHSSEMN